MTKEIMTAACLLASSTLMYAADLSAASATAPAKEINTLCDIADIAPVLEKFSASISVDYESEYIFRGKQLAYGVVCPEADIGYDIGSGFGAYIGWWGCNSVDGEHANYEENDIYCGATYSVENFTIDFGYTLFTYAGSAKNENEIKLMVSYDTSELLGDFAVSPYVAGFYNFTYSGTVIEGGLSYSAPVTKWILNQNWGTVDLAASVGYGDYSEGMTYGGGYTYVALRGDFNVALNDYCSISAGVRYSHNNDNDEGYAAIAGKEDNVWFGTSFSIGF